MQTRDPIVERIVIGEESNIPAIVVHQRLDTRDIARCHFDVEEKVEWDGEQIDEYIVHSR